MMTYSSFTTAYQKWFYEFEMEVPINRNHIGVNQAIKEKYKYISKELMLQIKPYHSKREIEYAAIKNIRRFGNWTPIK